MKKPIDTELQLLWKSISIVPINSIPSTYKEYGPDSLTFDHNGQKYRLKLSKIIRHKNKLK